MNMHNSDELEESWVQILVLNILNDFGRHILHF